MRIEVEEREVYGLVKVYVVNEPARSALAALMGRKCLRPSDVDALASLGHEVIVRGVAERVAGGSR